MPATDKPHVLLITTDHWPGSLLGCAGHPVVQTPSLDQLARSGVRFTRAYSECPVCIPARRTLMTGVPPSAHGDRTFQTELPMPPIPTLAQTFRNAGYQAYAAGKLHVYPQRDRIGFDDVILGEEGRAQYGVTDDYEAFLAERGFPGAQFLHGMSNNEYVNRPWHLLEDCHITNWTTRQMSRLIQRRDPTRPGFWYLAYSHPHPPLAPLQCYWDMYRDVELEPPTCGDWAERLEDLPFALRATRFNGDLLSEQLMQSAYRAFYALCTHIDHQLRVVIGTLREEGLLDSTVILFTADHGDMLGAHGLWAKRLFYEPSANVPMILVGAAGDARVGYLRTDDRLVGWQDVMPTLLDLAGVDIPGSVEGLSMVGEQRRDYLYGECNENALATRMLSDGRYKLIYYPVGNRTQLFDLDEDPGESENLADSPRHAEIRQRLTGELIQRLYGGDLDWLRDARLVGLPEQHFKPGPNRDLYLQRGSHWPPPPQA